VQEDYYEIEKGYYKPVQSCTS